MIRVRTLVLLLAVVCGPVAAQEPRPFPPPAAEKTVTLEARWVTVPVGYCDRYLPAGTGSVLTEKEVVAFVTDLASVLIKDVQVAPLMSVPSGREASVQVNDTRFFVTGLTAQMAGGTPVLVPHNQPIDIGPVVKVRPTVSTDGQSVKLDISGRRSVVEKVEAVPLVSQIRPAAGNTPPVSFTRYLDAPTISAKEVSRKLTVPVGGTAVVRGWREPAPELEPQMVMNAVPYLNRLFKTVSNKPAEVEVVLLVTAREVAAAKEVAAAPPEVIQAAAVEPAPPRVLVSALVMDVPAGFAAAAGLVDGEKGDTQAVLTVREERMLTALIRAAKADGKADVLSRPQIQVLDRQTGYIQVREESGPGMKAEIAPAVADDGRSVTLRVRFERTAAVPGPNRAAVALKATETATVPFARTVVLNFTSGRLGDGSGKDTLLILTPHLVRATGEAQR
jgi:hypothetical protein